MSGGASATVATVVTDIGDILTGVVGWFGNAIDFVTGNPLLFVCVAIPIGTGLVYGAVKLIKKFTGRKKI